MATLTSDVERQASVPITTRWLPGASHRQGDVEWPNGRRSRPTDKESSTGIRCQLLNSIEEEWAAAVLWATVPGIRIASVSRSVLRQLAKSTEGFTGSEIEQVFLEALYRAFEAGEEPNDLTIGLALTEFVPLSKLMVKQLSGLRSWSKGRARPATSPAPEQKGRRIAA